MRSAFTHASGRHANVASVCTEVLEGIDTEVSHAALEATCELLEDLLDAARDFFEGFDAFSSNLLGLGGRRLVVPVTRGSACLHGTKAAHSAVLFIEFAVDFHDLARSLTATSEKIAKDDRIGERHGFYDVTTFGDAAVGNNFYAKLGGGLGCHINGGELRDADACHYAGGADAARALANLDSVCARFGEKLHALGGGHIACDKGKLGELITKKAHGIAYARAMTMSSGDGEGVHAFADEVVDVGKKAVSIYGARGSAGGGDCGAANEAELGIARRLKIGLLLLVDALNIGESEEAAELA